MGREFDALGYNKITTDRELQWQATKADRFGDVIIGRRDIGASYHIAVTHDDAAQGVTHIVRGQDLEAQTDVHVLIQKLLGWPHPVYLHHNLLLREDGQKLAKRNSDPSIRAQREAGRLPGQIWADIV